MLINLIIVLLVIILILLIYKTPAEQTNALIARSNAFIATITPLANTTINDLGTIIKLTYEASDIQGEAKALPPNATLAANVATLMTSIKLASSSKQQST